MGRNPNRRRDFARPIQPARQRKICDCVKFPGADSRTRAFDQQPRQDCSRFAAQSVAPMGPEQVAQRGSAVSGARLQHAEFSSSAVVLWIDSESVVQLGNCPGCVQLAPLRISPLSPAARGPYQASDCERGDDTGHGSDYSLSEQPVPLVARPCLGSRADCRCQRAWFVADLPPQLAGEQIGDQIASIPFWPGQFVDVIT